MYIHPDGSVTGSVNQQVLDAYTLAKKEGRDLSEFAPFLAENSPEAKAAQGAPVYLPGGQQASPEAQAADERVAAQSQAAQESSDQRSADLAAQLSQSQPGGQQAAPEGETKPEFYGAWSLAELQDEAVARGLAKSGTKAELAERLADHDAGTPAEEV